VSVTASSFDTSSFDRLRMRPFLLLNADLILSLSKDACPYLIPA
jgi:hypothetical protein